jgi:hypothetical protein
MNNKSIVALLVVLLFILVSCNLQKTQKDSYPRLLVFDSQKSDILRKIENYEWAAQIYNNMVSRVTPYVDRHQTDPEWILSRYQMNWKPGAHYTQHISDPSGTELIAWAGNAPYPTVRVTTHKRPPVAPDGYRYKAPSLEEIEPYSTDSLWYLQSTGPAGEWSWTEPRLLTGGINEKINSLAVESAIIYWLTGDERFARFSSDILFQWARGAYYQDPVEGAGRNGLFCIQSLGDRNYDDLAIAYDFVRDYIHEAEYETHYFQPVFEKLAQITKLRGFVTNNWYAAQTTTLTYNALSLDDPQKQSYYLSFFLERDTIMGVYGQLALPTTMGMHFTDDGHWKENAGYHDMPVGDLLLAAVPVENNGYRVFEQHPALFQASYAMLRYSFPNLQLMGFGDIGGWKHQSPRNLEIAIRFASQYAPDMLPGLTGSLKRLMEAGLYDRANSGWYGLLTFLAILPEQDENIFEWDRSFSLDFAGLYGHRNGTGRETGLMHYVQGATYNHNHANGMAMELYGRGYILGADPGIAATYEDSVFVHYYATFAAHNTVIAAGASQPSVPFYGSGSEKHMGKINLSVMEPETDSDGVSPYTSFTETNYLEPSTNTLQQRVMGIVRTSADAGYYVDFFRSNNTISNDYIYHNIGNSVTLTDMSRNPVNLKPGSIPYRTDRQSGMGWLKEIRTPERSLSGAVAIFRVEEEDQDDVFMQMLMPLHIEDKVYTATGPRSRTAPSRISHLPTPKAIIHRPAAAWNEPFAVIYEPYRGDEGYSVRSVKRLSTGSSFAALEVENRDGSRQIIIHSDKPEVDRKVQQINITGHYGVIALNANNSLKYIYLGHGQTIGWNGYQLGSSGSGIASFVEFSDDYLLVSCNQEITLRFPYTITEVKDHEGNLINVGTDTSGKGSVFSFPGGVNRKYYLSVIN